MLYEPGTAVLGPGTITFAGGLFANTYRGGSPGIIDAATNNPNVIVTTVSLNSGIGTVNLNAGSGTWSVSNLLDLRGGSNAPAQFTQSPGGV